jgi:hypothetical protein
VARRLSFFDPIGECGGATRQRLNVASNMSYVRDHSPHWKSLDIAERALIGDIEVLDNSLADADMTTAVHLRWIQENAAVVKLQRWFRHWKLKASFVFKFSYYVHVHAATVVQSVWRGYKARVFVHGKKLEFFNRTYKLKNGILQFDPKMFAVDMKRVVTYVRERDRKELPHWKTKMMSREAESRHNHKWMNYWEQLEDDDFNVRTNSPRWSVISDEPFFEDPMDVQVNATVATIVRNAMNDNNAIQTVTNKILENAAAACVKRGKDSTKPPKSKKQKKEDSKKKKPRK